jgi:hypothetical protein
MIRDRILHRHEPPLLLLQPGFTKARLGADIQMGDGVRPKRSSQTDGADDSWSPRGTRSFFYMP